MFIELGVKDKNIEIVSVLPTGGMRKSTFAIKCSGLSWPIEMGFRIQATIQTSAVSFGLTELILLFLT